MERGGGVSETVMVMMVRATTAISRVAGLLKPLFSLPPREPLPLSFFFFVFFFHFVLLITFLFSFGPFSSFCLCKLQDLARSFKVTRKQDLML